LNLCRVKHMNRLRDCCCLLVWALFSKDEQMQAVVCQRVMLQITLIRRDW
jgi:hypothetical protein